MREILGVPPSHVSFESCSYRRRARRRARREGAEIFRIPRVPNTSETGPVPAAARLNTEIHKFEYVTSRREEKKERRKEGRKEGGRKEGPLLSLLSLPGLTSRAMILVILATLLTDDDDDDDHLLFRVDSKRIKQRAIDPAKGEWV